jgi:hypothetical protein
MRKPTVAWPILALALLASQDSSAAGPLPRLAVSLPASVAPIEVSRLVRACGPEDVLVVLPPMVVPIGGSGPPLTQSRAALELPQRTYLRLRVEVTAMAAAGSEREALIERQIEDLVRVLALDRPGLAGLVVESTAPADLSDVRQFALATLIVKSRGVRPGLEIAIEAPDGPARQRLLAYADSVVLPSQAAAQAQAAGADQAAAGRPLTSHIVVSGADDGRAGSVAWLDFLTTREAAAVSTVWIDLPGPAALRGLCATMQSLSRALGGGFEMTAPERAPVAVLVDGRPASTAVAFVGSRTADVTVLLRSGGSREAPRALTLAGASGSKLPQVACVDAVDGRSLEAKQGADPGCRADADYVVFQARIPTGADRVFESVNVSARAALRVEEIIARWQAAREAERALLDTYSVPCFLVLHFEATNLAAAFDVALELEQFWNRYGVNDWVQTAFRVNGVKLRRGQAFPLPQLEPDKVVTKPLELRLDDKYTYALAGTETVDGRVSYVVEITPGESSESLYSGRVWIDGVDFRQVRLRLEQRDGKNNVAAHIETQEFGRVTDERGREFTLVRSIDAEDAINLGGRSITLEKRYRFGAYTVNAAGFDARLASMRAAGDPMFRDTADGMRGLRRQGTELVVEPNTSKVIKAALGGVLYDGGRSYPVPLAGVSWVDFDFRKTGNQLSAFFAGPLFVANLSHQVNKSFRWGADLSLNALPNTFTEYSGDTELTGSRVRNFEQFIGGLLNWQVTAALDLSTQFDLYYDIYQATDATDPRYRVPASGVTLDNYGEAKYVRRGFSAIATIEHGQRLGWREFGYPDEPTEPVLPSWTRYSIEVSQHLFVGKLTRGGVTAGYFGGHDLDRFSRYVPSLFARPSITGLPTGVDSFDEVTNLGGYYGFNVFDIAKLQGSYAHAWTRNKSEGNDVRQFDGVNVSIGIAGPFGTFVQGAINVALRGNLERYKTPWGIYLIVLKPWRK